MQRSIRMNRKESHVEGIRITADHVCFWPTLTPPRLPMRPLFSPAWLGSANGRQRRGGADLAYEFRPDVVVLDAELLDESGWLTSAKISLENPAAEHRRRCR